MRIGINGNLGLKHTFINMFQISRKGRFQPIVRSIAGHTVIIGYLLAVALLIYKKLLGYKAQHHHYKYGGYNATGCDITDLFQDQQAPTGIPPKRWYKNRRQ